MKLPNTPFQIPNASSQKHHPNSRETKNANQNSKYANQYTKYANQNTKYANQNATCVQYQITLFCCETIFVINLRTFLAYNFQAKTCGGVQKITNMRYALYFVVCHPHLTLPSPYSTRVWECTRHKMACLYCLCNLQRKYEVKAWKGWKCKNNNNTQ